MENMKKSWETRLKEAQASHAPDEGVSINEQRKVGRTGALCPCVRLIRLPQTVPNFWNINEDAALQGVICHLAGKNPTSIGSKKADPPADIQFSGLGIHESGPCNALL